MPEAYPGVSSVCFFCSEWGRFTLTKRTRSASFAFNKEKYKKWQFFAWKSTFSMVKRGLSNPFNSLTVSTTTVLLTLKLLVAITKWCKKPKEMTETLAYGYLSESTQRGLSNEYQHDMVKMVSKILCILVLWTKVASALDVYFNPSNAKAS